MTQQAPAPTWVGLGPCQTRGSRILYYSYCYDIIVVSILLFTHLSTFKFIFTVSLRKFIFGPFSIRVSKFSGISYQTPDQPHIYIAAVILKNHIQNHIKINIQNHIKTHTESHIKMHIPNHIKTHIQNHMTVQI